MTRSGSICLARLAVLVLTASSATGASADAAASPWQLKKKIVVDDKAWNWNWASWDQEKVITFGHHQYTVYWDADQVFVLVRRDLRTNAVQKLRLPKFTLKNNDGHRNTCLGVSAADGRIHLSWDHHNDQLRYTKSRAGLLTDPPKRLTVADIEPRQAMLSDPKLETRVTYPRFLTDPKGTLYCTYRIGGSGNGNNYLHRYDAKTGTWTRIGMLFSRRGTYAPWNNSKSRCAYLHDLLFDRTGRLHATWVYREISASWASNHDLHYATSDDGGKTWHNNAGKKVADLPAGDPIELSDEGLVVVKIPIYSWLMNAACMALDGKNRPHVVTFRSPETHKPAKLEHNPPKKIRLAQCFYHYWRDEGGTWHETRIDPHGTLTRRPDIVFDQADTLYFHYSTPEGFRGFRACASDRWRTWDHYTLTGPDILGKDASKHDRVLWRERGILSFTAQTPGHGFCIVDFKLRSD